jgi:hypothetical protein
VKTLAADFAAASSGLIDIVTIFNWSRPVYAKKELNYSLPIQKKDKMAATQRRGPIVTNDHQFLPNLLGGMFKRCEFGLTKSFSDAETISAYIPIDLSSVDMMDLILPVNDIRGCICRSSSQLNIEIPFTAAFGFVRSMEVCNEGVSISINNDSDGGAASLEPRSGARFGNCLVCNHYRFQ